MKVAACRIALKLNLAFIRKFCLQPVQSFTRQRHFHVSAIDIYSLFISKAVAVYS